jgi:predicted nuclease with TOPRIM domain
LGEGGSAGQVRASIRLKPEVAKVWARLDKATRARLGALFNDLVLLYGRTGRLPVTAVLDITSLDLLLKGLEACKMQLRLSEEEIGRLTRELEEVKARLDDMRGLEARLGESQQIVENLRRHASSLESDLRECRDKANYYGYLIFRLAESLCTHKDELSKLAGDRGAVYVERLCESQYKTEGPQRTGN